MSEKEIAFGKIQDDKIILNAWGDQPERTVGEVKNDDEEGSVDYFTKKFAELEQKINALEKEIDESQNKGSFLMKLIHLKDLLHTHDGLGDYLQLRKRLENQEILLKELIEKNRERNSDIKNSLLQEVTAAAANINWREATEEIHDIKSRWIKTGNAREEENETLDREFWSILEKFFDKKKQFYEDKKLLGEKRKRDYEALVSKAAGLENMHGKERFDLVKLLKEEWKEIGNIPREEYVPLLKMFNAKLKGSQKSPRPPSLNLDEVNQQLDEYLQENKPVNSRQIENYKRSLKFYRPTDHTEKAKRKSAFGKIQLLQEQEFVDQLALKRFKNFEELERVKKRSIRVGILEELIHRDQTDLEKYQENSSHFSGTSGGMIDLIEKKLIRQQNKIATKKELLERIRTES